MKPSVNATCPSTAPANKNSVQPTSSNATLKTAKTAKLIATKAHVDRTTISAKCFGDQPASHTINVITIIRMEVDTETAATIYQLKRTRDVNRKMFYAECCNVDI